MRQSCHYGTRVVFNKKRRGDVIFFFYRTCSWEGTAKKDGNEAAKDGSRAKEAPGQAKKKKKAPAVGAEGADPKDEGEDVSGPDGSWRKQLRPSVNEGSFFSVPDLDQKDQKDEQSSATTAALLPADADVPDEETKQKRLSHWKKKLCSTSGFVLKDPLRRSFVGHTGPG